MGRRRRTALVFAAIIIVKILWNQGALNRIFSDEQQLSINEKINAASPEPAITSKDKDEVKQVFKTDVIKEIKEKDEKSMPRVIPQKVSHLKENNENSNINMQDTQHKMIARLLKNNAIPHFQTQMDMKELNVYYRSPPSCSNRRKIIREYTEMWREEHDDPTTPMTSILPRIKFFTVETPSTKSEASENEDLVLVESDSYDAKFNHVKCDEMIWEENKNMSAKYDEEIFLKSLEYAGNDEFTGPNTGHVFLKDTDLVNFDTIRNVSRKIGDETDLNEGILCFGKITSRVSVPYCGNKIFMRGDTTQKLMKFSTTIRNFPVAQEITGFQRNRAGISALVFNDQAQRTKAIVTLPYMDWSFSNFSEHFHEWAMDLKPTNRMTYNLPDLYVKDRPISDPWSVGLVQAPPCPEKYSILSLIKSARQNEKIRTFIRIYTKLQDKFYPPDANPLNHKMHVPLRFILGKESSTEDPELTKRIEEEIKEHGDIIVGDFIDTYENLPLKTLTGYEYIKNVCDGPTAVEYFIFHDDDTLLSYQKLAAFVKEKSVDLSCMAYKGSHARPYRWGKYNVTTEQWASGHWLPQFCTGPCNIMSRKTAMKILQAAEKTDPKGFKLEDVLFTGIIRTKAGLAAPDEAPKGICMMGEGLAFIAAGVNRFINANKLNWNPQKKTPWVNTNLENKLNYLREHILGDLVEDLPEYKAWEKRINDKK